jgi:hypothetical protein
MAGEMQIDIAFRQDIRREAAPEAESVFSHSLLSSSLHHLLGVSLAKIHHLDSHIFARRLGRRMQDRGVADKILTVQKTAEETADYVIRRFN